MTEKGRSYEMEKCCSSFRKTYLQWKENARGIRLRLREHCSIEMLEDLKFRIQEQAEMLQGIVERLHRIGALQPDVVQKMDTCNELTLSLIEMIDERIEEAVQVDDDEKENTPDFVYKSDVHLRLPKKNNPSVFGDSLSSGSVMNYEESHHAQEELVTVNSVSTLAPAATKQTPSTALAVKPNSDIHQHLEQTQEIRAGTDQERHPPQDVVNDRSAQDMRFGCGEEKSVQMIADAISRLDANKLPAPEPPVFDGDAITFTSWKASFNILIRSKNLTNSEKMFYLQRYLTGEAKRCIQGLFLLTSPDSFTKAWELLERRYGNSFCVAEAFRDRLHSWPEIPGNSPRSLRDYSDFLTLCNIAAQENVNLRVLDDPHENKNMLKKLPYFIQREWAKYAGDYSVDTYPKFQDFTEFIQRTSDRLNNPILSDFYSTRPKAKPALNARNLSTDTRREGQESCNFCGMTNHSLATCRKFRQCNQLERSSFIKKKGLCFGCLNSGHLSKQCKDRATCDICGKKHPTCLHGDKPSTPTASPVATDSTNMKSTIMLSTRSSQEGCSAAVPVLVSSEDAPDKEIMIYALLDTQSDTTFIAESIGGQLSSVSIATKLRVSTLTSTKTVMCQRYTGLRVRGINEKEYVKLPPTYSRDHIPAKRSHIPTDETAKNWPHLHCIKDRIPPLQNCDVAMIIGYDCPAALAPLQVISGKNMDPFAQRTILGWSIIGCSGPSTGATICNRTRTKEVPLLTPSDALGCLEADFKHPSSETETISQEDFKFIQIMEENIKEGTGGRFEMPLPFREARPKMPNNRSTAHSRLMQLKKKFSQDPKYYQDYKHFMKEVIERGDAEEATCNNSSWKWYIPHHGVYHHKKPDKIRVVFDCSSRTDDTSLNDKLIPGPDLTNGLTGVLLRFRRYSVAISCDVERMFHQFQVPDQDRDYLRFLWWENGDLNGPIKEYRMTVHLFGAASSPSCANFGFHQIASVHGKDKPNASHFILRGFYVDDGLTSTNTPEEAIKLIGEVRHVCKAGGLRLHKILSNDRQVLHSVPPSERAKELQEVSLSEELPITSTLGMRWVVDSDELSFDVSLKESHLTRRGVLSAVASIYDPLGLVAPFVLKGKMILQEACRNGIGWDDALSPSLTSRWEDWYEDRLKLKTLRFPRCYQPPDFPKITSRELHHFSDASLSGYGQCSYLKLLSTDRVHCSLIYAKARVAPSKALTTIPRLELSAAVLSVQASDYIKAEIDLKIDKEYFWTDSQVVLSYLQSDTKRFHMFVANRIKRIRLSSSVEQWNYVPSAENPADYASRGLDATQLNNFQWLQGPPFLWKKLILQVTSPTLKLEEEDPEVRRSTIHSVKTGYMPLIDYAKKFSSLDVVMRAFGRLIRRAKGIKSSSPCSYEEQKAALTLLVRSSQEAAFSEEIDATLRASKQPCRNRKLQQLSPFVEGGVLRVGGRLRHSSLPNDVKHPAILPKDCHLTKLLVLHYHENIRHGGRGQTMNEIRRWGYWIVGGSAVVSSIIHRCVQCRKVRRPAEGQKMADLPPERIEPSAPFTHIGMDCFGPFATHAGRKQYKRYGLLFTCMASRAVHIELLEDLSTDSFINALRCLISLRGSVSTLRSDQGTNFVGGENELRRALKELDHNKLQIFLGSKQCQFLKNPPHASHAGGVWERQIRTIRSTLTSIVEKPGVRLDDWSLRTLFYESMFIVNSRPLSVTNLNDPTAPIPLTPNHILTLKTTTPLPPPGQFVVQDVYLRKRWRRVQFLTEQFWSRWRKEYLLQLTQRQRWTGSKRNLQIGDVVIMKEEMSHRNHWKLARVSDCFPSKDGLVRRVKIQVANSSLDDQGRPKQRTSILERPVQQLVLLIEAQAP